MKIVVLESLSVGEDISWEPLRQFGELTLCRDLTQNDIKEAIKDADIIIPNDNKHDVAVDFLISRIKDILNSSN